jgi:hypothetical protein
MKLLKFIMREGNMVLYMHLNNIKSPLFMLKVLMLHLFYLPMLVASCFNNLFSYKIPLHRKWVRLMCWIFASWCILICSIYTYESIIEIIMSILMAIKKELLGDNPLYFCFQFIFVSLSLGSCYLCRNLSLSFLFRFCAKSSL